MLDTKKINEMVQNIVASLPPALKNLPKELESNIKMGLQAGLHKLDVVTREEFDAQTGVLLRTRKKIDELEKRVKELEEQRMQ